MKGTKRPLLYMLLYALPAVISKGLKYKWSRRLMEIRFLVDFSKRRRRFHLIYTAKFTSYQFLKKFLRQGWHEKKVSCKARLHYRAGELSYRSMRGLDGNPFLSATALELFSFIWPSCHLTSLVICLAWLFSVILYVMSWNKTKMLDNEKTTLQGLESFLHLIFPSRKETEYYLDNHLLVSTNHLNCKYRSIL